MAVNALTSERRATARDVGLILVLLAAALAPSMFTRDLWNPDEPRYMEVGREMVVLNDYLVPHLDNYLYAEKPPLFFWLAAGLYKLGFGVNAGRVAAALATLGTVLLTYFLGRRFLPRPGPLAAALTTLTCLIFMMTSKAGVIDPVVTFWVVLAIYLGVRALDEQERRGWLCWLGAYAAAGLGVLTKGPVALATPLLVLLAYAVAMGDRRRRGDLLPALGALALAVGGFLLFKRGMGGLHEALIGTRSGVAGPAAGAGAGAVLLLAALALLAYAVAARNALRGGGWIHAAGILCALGIVAAWAVPALLRVLTLPDGVDYVANIVFKQTSGRMVNSWSHEQPAYYYVMLLPAMLFPWTLLMAPAIGSAARDAWRRPEAGARLAVAWVVAILLFFSCISGKRGGYILPVFPAFGLLMGRYLALGMREPFPWPKAHRVLRAITILLFIVVAAAAVAVLPLADNITRLALRKHPELVAQVQAQTRGLLPIIAVASVLAVGVALVAWWSGSRRPRLCFAAIVVLTFIFSLAADIALLPRANFWKSGKEFCRTAEPYLRQADHAYLFRKDFSGVYNLYTGRLSMPVLWTGEDLLKALQGSEKIAVIGRDEELWKVLGNPPRLGRVVVTDRIGHREMFLLTSWDAPVHNGRDGGL